MENPGWLHWAEEKQMPCKMAEAWHWCIVASSNNTLNPCFAYLPMVQVKMFSNMAKSCLKNLSLLHLHLYHQWNGTWNKVAKIENCSALPSIVSNQDLTMHHALYDQFGDTSCRKLKLQRKQSFYAWILDTTCNQQLASSDYSLTIALYISWPQKSFAPKSREAQQTWCLLELQINIWILPWR